MSKTNKSELVTPICTVAKLLALEPHYNASCVNIKWQKCYALTLVMILSFGTAFSMYGKFIEMYPYEPITVAVIDALTYTLLTMSIAVAIIRASFFNLEKFKKYMKLLAEVRQLLKQQNIPDAIAHKFYLETVIAHVCIIGITTYDCFEWIKIFGVQVFLKYILKDIAEYACMIQVLLIYNYVIVINIYLERINKHLKNVKNHSESSGIKVNNFISERKDDVFERVTIIRKTYTKLSNMIEICNSLFGWQICFLCGIILLGILEIVNFALITTTTEKKQFDQNLGLEIGFIVLLFLWLLQLMTMGVLVAVVCDMTTKKAQDTATVCYNLLLEVPAASNDVQDRILREELMLLAQQATHTSSYFTAAGFFNVDYTMLFGLLGSVTSYIIVLIQIEK